MSSEANSQPNIPPFLRPKNLSFQQVITGIYCPKSNSFQYMNLGKERERMKQIFKTAGVIVMSLALLVSAGCGSDEKKVEVPSTPDKITLKFGHPADEKSTWHLAALKFKEIAEKNSHGRLIVKLYPNEQLGKEKDLVASIQNGTADLGIFGETLVAFGASKTILMATPYLLKDSVQLHKVAAGEIGKEIETQIIEKVRIHPIAYFERGPRDLTSNRAIMTPVDLKGLKVGVSNSPLFVDTWQALGANPVPVAFYEVFANLQQGSIEASENAYSLIKTANLFEVQKFLNKTNHIRSWAYVCLGEKRLQSLPADLQKVVLDAAKEMQIYENKIFLKNEQSLETYLKTKMTFIDVDISAFRAKSQDAVLAKFDADQKALYAKISNMK
ncbi:MAG: C4-dicarboxylate transporter [Firmicutes bacterium]|nr:C4-dicarboxylate transporter [Bacillota bacterium]